MEEHKVGHIPPQARYKGDVSTLLEELPLRISSRLNLGKKVTIIAITRGSRDGCLEILARLELPLPRRGSILVEVDPRIPICPDMSGNTSVYPVKAIETAVDVIVQELQRILSVLEQEKWLDHVTST